MKKILNTLAAVALAVTASLSFAACSDDDDDNNNNNNPANELQSIEWTLNANLEGEAASIFDYEVTIELPDSTSRTIADPALSMSSKATGTVQISDTELPATFAVTINRTVKEGFTPTEGQKASWSENFDLAIDLLNADREVIASKENGSEGKHTNVDLTGYLPKYGEKSSSFTITVKKSSEGYTFE